MRQAGPVDLQVFPLEARVSAATQNACCEAWGLGQGHHGMEPAFRSRDEGRSRGEKRERKL